MAIGISLRMMMAAAQSAGGGGEGTWLLRATWDSASDQGYTNSQVLTLDSEGVEDGQLTVAEADGTLAVVSNKLSFTPQSTPAWGDLGIYGGGITREAGLGLLSRVEVQANNLFVVPAVLNDAADAGLANRIYTWYVTDTTGAKVLVGDGAGTDLDSTAGVFYLRYAYMEMLIVLGGFSSTQTVWESGDATSFTYGAHLFAKNLTGGWTRHWVTHRDNTATLYPAFANSTHTGRVDSFRIPDTSYIDFKNALVPSDYLGGSRSGSDTFTHPAENFIAKFVLTYDGNYGFLEFRKVDASNRYFIDFSSGNLRLFQTVGGSNTQLASASSFAATNTYAVTIVSRQRYIQVYVNGALKINYTGALRFTSATGGALGSVISGGIRDLATWELYPSGDALTVLESATDLDLPGTFVARDGHTLNDQNKVGYRYDAMATVDISGTQYQVMAYWDYAGSMVIAKRTLPAGGWTFYRYDGVNQTSLGTVTNDNHNCVNIGIDPNGYLHVAYNMHSNSLLYRRSDNPISTWTGGMTSTLSMVGTNESAVTYPTFFNDPNGKLYFMFRDGSSGNGDLFMYAYTEGTTTWAAATGTSTGGKLLDGKTSVDSPYWNGPPWFDSDFGSGGYMHLSWHWRTDSGGYNFDVSYVKWDGTNWVQADGTAQTVPITPSNGEIIDDTTGDVALSSFNGTVSDDNGDPHIFYPKNDGSGFGQIYHIWHNGTSWQGPTALTSNTTLASSGDTDVRPINVAAAVDQSTGKVFVFYNGKGYGEGGGIYVRHSTDYSAWTKETVDAGDASDWRPTFDRTYWRLNGVFHFPVQVFDMRLVTWTP